MSISKSQFGQMPDGTTVDLYTLTNATGMVAKFLTYGTVLTELHVPDRTGKLGDVVLGFDNLSDYIEHSPYFGCTTGRVANRIAGASFGLNGVEYQLAKNNGPNHLHGGKRGLDKVVWKAQKVEGRDGPSLMFTHLSPHMDEGYPGNLHLIVIFTLTHKNELKIDYKATTDRPTPVNLTNHTYFNLAGAGDILDHEMMINADRYTAVDDALIPTGEIASLNGSPLDFRQPTPIGQRIAMIPPGYDHNYVLNNADGGLNLAARVREPRTGRIMEVLTTEPGVQFYAGNFLKGVKGKAGQIYHKHTGFCLETQHFPDAVHHPHFPSIILEPHKTYSQVTLYRFST